MCRLLFLGVTKKPLANICKNGTFFPFSKICCVHSENIRDCFAVTRIFTHFLRCLVTPKRHPPKYSITSYLVNSSHKRPRKLSGAIFTLIFGSCQIMCYYIEALPLLVYTSKGLILLLLFYYIIFCFVNAVFRYVTTNR